MDVRWSPLAEVVRCDRKVLDMGCGWLCATQELDNPGQATPVGLHVLSGSGKAVPPLQSFC